MSVCLDSFAVLAWLQSEPGASEVDAFLGKAERESAFRCVISAINLGEVYYRLWRTRGQAGAEQFWEDAWRGDLPLTVIEPTRKRILQAARLKAQYPIAFADAFAVQLAQEIQAPLVTGDSEIRAITDKESLSLLWIGMGK
jgi:uncharacterized protein